MSAWTIANEPDVNRIEVYDTLEEAREKFGENYGGFVFMLTPTQVTALQQGKVIAFDISDREYAGFLTLGQDSQSS